MGVKTKKKKKTTTISFISKAIIKHFTASKTVTFAEPISEFYDECGFNAPGFELYDSTPYGGGYDPNLTYGKPLQPSDSTCYPASSVSDPSSGSVNKGLGFSYSSIPSPYGEDKVDQKGEPRNGSPVENPDKEEVKVGGGGGDGGLVSDDLGKEERLSDGEGLGSIQDVGFVEKENLVSGFDNQPWSGGGYGGESVDVPQPPSANDVGAYAVLASYFPCLSKKNKKIYDYEGLGGYGQSCGIQWRGTEEYLFGNLYPYTERRVDDVSYGYPGYRYERHYPEQPRDVQIEYNEEPHYAQIEYNEKPHYAPIEYNEEPHYAQIEYNEEQHYALVEYNERTNYVEADHYEQSWLQNQQYSEMYPIEYNEEPSYVQVEHNEQSSSQTPAYSEAYQDEYYYPLNHDNETFKSRYFHYNQFEYSDQ